jgi:hypothetical protein
LPPAPALSAAASGGVGIRNMTASPGDIR